MIKSLTKPLNLFLSGYSYLRGSITGNVKIAGMPVAISTELTNNCNLDCPECLSGSGLMNRDRGFMDIELFDSLISEVGDYLYNINLYFQEEPMLHPFFFTFIERCRNINSVVSTNGHFLT